MRKQRREVWKRRVCSPNTNTTVRKGLAGEVTFYPKQRRGYPGWRVTYTSTGSVQAGGRSILGELMGDSAVAE